MVPEFDVKESARKVSSNDKVSIILGPLNLLVVILYIVISKGWNHDNHLVLFIFLPFVLIQETLLFIPKFKNMKLFNSGGVFPLIVYNSSLLLAFIFYVPIYSPFLIVMALIIYLTVFFRGTNVLIFSCLNSIAIVGLYYLRNGNPAGEYTYLYPYMLGFLAITYSVIIQRAGATDRRIRADLITANDKIAEDRGQLSSLINGIKDSVIATDEKGNIVFYNSETLKLLAKESINPGTPLNSLFKLYDEESNIFDFNSIYNPRHDQQIISNMHVIDNNNQNMYLSFEISKINSTNAQSGGVIVLIRDITKEKSLDERRDEFIAVTSHELRTPIAIAEANLSMAINKANEINADPSLQNRLEESHTSILNLADLINELTELSSVDRENVGVQNEILNPMDVITQLQTDLRAEAEKKGLRLLVEHLDGLKPVSTSKVYLTEILENFITNSIKYTKTGSITLKANFAQNDQNSIVFSVTDTGDGISNSDKDKIFTKFYRAEDYKTKNTRGTGLGLYLAVKLSKAIDGKIWFDSVLGNGSTFYLQIPAIANENQTSFED